MEGGENKEQHEVGGGGEVLRPVPRIWVASLADYNAGRLYGDWLDAAQEKSELEEAIVGLLARAPTPGAEECAIFDADGFAGLRIDGHESLDVVSRLARGIKEHGPAFAAWSDIAGRDAETLEAFEASYLGEWGSLAAYAEHLFEELGYQEQLDQAVPPCMQPYVRFDSEAFGRDLQLSGEVNFAHAPTGGIWLFASRW